MDLSFTDEDLAFQAEVRGWIEDNYSEELRAKNALSKNGYLDKDGMIAKLWRGAGGVTREVTDVRLKKLENPNSCSSTSKSNNARPV